MYVHLRAFYGSNLGADISIAAIITAQFALHDFYKTIIQIKKLYRAFIGITSQLLAYNFVL